MNDIALLNAITFIAYGDTNRLLTLLGHYVCFQKKKKIIIIIIIIKLIIII